MTNDLKEAYNAYVDWIAYSKDKDATIIDPRGNIEIGLQDDLRDAYAETLTEDQQEEFYELDIDEQIDVIFEELQK